MPIRTYRLTSTNTGGGAGASGISLTSIIARGTIVGIAYALRGQGGAADGFYGVEVALNNPTTPYTETTTAAPSEFLLCRCMFALDTGDAEYANGYMPFNRAVVPGNTLCINQTQSGTAAVGVAFGFDVFVNE